MSRLVLLAVVPCFFAVLSRAADEAKGEKLQYATFPAYFEKNNSGLKGNSSLLAFTNRDAFAKVFALRPPLMGGKKSVPLPEKVFEKDVVLAVIMRGNAITTYTVERVTSDGNTIFVQYKTKTGQAGTAQFASPLIIAASRGKAKKAVFIENGKMIGTIDIPSR